MVNNGKQINTFNKGMNKDVAAEVYDNTHYTDARWLSPIVNEENNIGTLVNPKGTGLKFAFHSGEKVVGHTTLRDMEIFITVDGSNCTHIYKYQDDNTLNDQIKTISLHIPTHSDEGLQ